MLVPSLSSTRKSASGQHASELWLIWERRLRFILGALWIADGLLQLLPIASIVVSLIIWYTTEAFGMIFTGMATDFNSGLLLVVKALACIPKQAAVTTSEPVSRQVARQI
jgi:hypothetical protein